MQARAPQRAPRVQHGPATCTPPTTGLHSADVERLMAQLHGLVASGAELVSMSQRAMRDETEHARRCFTLASRYAGAPLGPTALDLAGAFEEESLASIVRLAFREGCVGETCAALEASEALALARDPLVRATLALITEDERRHAELAWRFVAWALDRDVGGELRELVRVEIQRLRTEQRRSPLSSRRTHADPASPLVEHGVLGRGRSSELRQAAITELVLPCADRLLSSKAPAGARPATRAAHLGAAHSVGFATFTRT